MVGLLVFLKPSYRNRHTELSVEGDCLLWGTRVIIPKKLQGSVLNELHSNHLECLG